MKKTKNICMVLTGTVIILVILISRTYSQNVLITDDSNYTAKPSAILDIKSSTEGLLIPRLGLFATNSGFPVNSPDTSLLVYNTDTSNDVVPGYYYWNGAEWVPLSGINGATGPTGADGIDGVTGPTGADGINGVTGPTGVTGAKGATGANGSRASEYYCSSATSNIIGKGSREFVLACAYGSQQAYSTASRARIASSASPSNWIEGNVTYSASPSLTINVDTFNGSGTYSSWYVSLIGAVGDRGAAGPQGITGFTGIQGPTGPTGIQGPAGTDGLQSAPNALYIDTTNQITANASTSYPITFNVNMVQNGFTHTVGTSVITSINAGTYLITFSGSFQCTASNIIFNVWIRINGINYNMSNTSFELSDAALKNVVSASKIITLTAGQYFEIIMQSNDASGGIFYTPAQYSPNIPITPSMILSVNKISQ
jgi:hypothetical protein